MASNRENMDLLIAAQTSFDQAFSPAILAERSIWKFDASATGYMPMFIDTGYMSGERPLEKKLFRGVDVHGVGQFSIRVWVDGKLVVPSGKGTATESPSRPRHIAVPRGTKGYAIRVELCGMLELVRSIVVIYDGLPTISSSE